jgi:hypothetical protein
VIAWWWARRSGVGVKARPEGSPAQRRGLDVDVGRRMLG